MTNTLFMTDNMIVYAYKNNLYHNVKNIDEYILPRINNFSYQIIHCHCDHFDIYLFDSLLKIIINMEIKCCPIFISDSIKEIIDKFEDRKLFRQSNKLRKYIKYHIPKQYKPLH